VLQAANAKLPVIAAPMFLVSGPEIVSACCKAGIVGTFPALNQRTSEGFDEWLTNIEKELSDLQHPGFGVNLIVHKTNPRLQQDLDICVKHKVPLVITSLGAVKDLVDAVHSYGGKVFHDVTTLRHAQKAADAGVDGLIAVSAGAGGHAGTLHPLALLGEIKKFFSGTLIMSGCLSTGADVAAAIAAGADYAYMGTRFICTDESRAAIAYKTMIEQSNAKDIVYTDKVSGVYANFLGASLAAANADHEAASGAASTPTKGAEIDFGKELLAPEDGDAKAWKDIWSAGHGVGNINSTLPVKSLVNELVSEYQAAIQRATAAVPK